MDNDTEVIHVDSDHDESEEDDSAEASTSGELFSAPQQVFIVRGLSKAMTGFRPSVMCDGYLAELSKISSGYILAPLGQDQQLSFKYEPPSPKFSRKRPSCVSYRLQLLHGSQFLYSLRGLPKALRYQRSTNALEWGPVHLMFSAATDLDTFLSTIKYVDVEEMGCCDPEAQAGSETPEPPAAAEPHPAAPSPAPVADSGSGRAAGSGVAGADAGVSTGGGGGGVRGFSLGGSGMLWAQAASRLLSADGAAAADAGAGAGAGAAGSPGGGAGPSPEVPALAAAAAPAAAPATTSTEMSAAAVAAAADVAAPLGTKSASGAHAEAHLAAPRTSSFFSRVFSQPLASQLAAAGAAVLVAAIAALLLSRGGRARGRGQSGA